MVCHKPGAGLGSHTLADHTSRHYNSAAVVIVVPLWHIDIDQSPEEILMFVNTALLRNADLR